MSPINPKERIVIAILNWNGLHHLKTYLPDVIEHSKKDAHIALIANGSTDDSIDWCAQNHPEIEIIQLASNL